MRDERLGEGVHGESTSFIPLISFGVLQSPVAIDHLVASETQSNGESRSPRAVNNSWEPT